MGFLKTIQALYFKSKRSFSKTHSLLGKLVPNNKAPLKPHNLESWKVAIHAASDPENPNRIQLTDLYNNLMLDNNLAGCINTRLFHVQRSAFKIVDRSGKPNNELHSLLRRPWFDNLIRKAVFSLFQGATLIEMYEVNEEGELAEIAEIPQVNFIPQKGIVVKNPSDQQGWNYKEPGFTDYYLQIGQNNDLGILASIAPIILAKKLGLGSWLDYIDKYGVPSMVVKADREDHECLTNLHDAMTHFKSKGFFIGRGGTEVVMDKSPSINPNSDAVFQSLIALVDNEVSKRILGVAGITKQRLFKGAGNIQYDILKNRFESDKTFFKYLFNTEIKQRLVNLSPIYAGFKDHYFEWDNFNSLSQEEIIEAVSTLSKQFVFDPSYVSNMVGLRVNGGK